MADYSAHVRGKKITLMGLGLLGRGVGDAEFLAEAGAELIVTDLKPEASLAPSLERLKKFSNITYRLGEHALEDFRGRDYIVKAAGVPLDSPYIAEARNNGIPIKMSASWFAELANVPVVGVTGTRGKTTTTYMLYDILRAAGKHVLLGGNIRGVSTLALLPQVQADSIALFELDSWQCQGWGEAQMSPHVAVFTTFMSDHMNYYHNDMAAYLADKAQIFLHQTSEDTLVVSEEVLSQLGEYTARMRASVRVPEQRHIELSVPGAHNQLNARCALEAARALGIDDTTALTALKAFTGVPGRLELVRSVNGVRFYNDTTATAPEATLAALEALHSNGEGKTILIMGGADKGLRMDELVARIPTHTDDIIFLSGSGTDRVRAAFPDAPVYDSLKTAVAHAVAIAEEGDSVLLSPAFASFGMFQNEYDRGDQFASLVKDVPDVELLKPKVRRLARELQQACTRDGFLIMISHGFRSFAEQDALYAKGRTEPGQVVSNARGGESFHNYGVAFDIRPVASSDAEREKLRRRAGPLGEALGLSWGGRWETFQDLPHFEYTGGYSLKDFRAGTLNEEDFA